MVEANINTTDLEVPQTMHIDSLPAPQPIEADDEAPPIFEDKVRNDIFAKRQAMLEREMEDQGLPTNKQDDVVIEPVHVVAIEKPIEPVQSEKDDFILNVYGKEEKYDLDNPSDRERLKQEAQKGRAATQVFQEGYRMKEDGLRAMQEAQRIAELVKQNLQPQPAASTNTPHQAQLDDNLMRDVAKRINYGSEDEQAAALRDYGAIIADQIRGQTQVLPPDQLVDIATKNAVAVLDARAEQEILKKEFVDILSDKPLAHATDIILNDLYQNYQQQGVQKSRLELFREAGNIAREKYLRPSIQEIPAQQPITVQAATSLDKLERKRAAPKSPVAANKISSEPPPAYGVGVGSIVNQMRKARGQPVLN